MRQKIILMIFCANQGFIVHSPRLRSLFATRPYSFIKHHAMVTIVLKFIIVLLDFNLKILDNILCKNIQKNISMKN